MAKFPFIKQHDIKDCGAACLGMISAYYGYKTPLSQIRYKVGTNSRGSTVLGIVNAAREIGFESNGFQTDDKENAIFDDIPLPAIAHVIVDGKLAHFVVIYHMTKTKITLGDPAQGIVSVSVDEFLQEWTGVIITFMPGISFKKTNEKRGMFTRFFGLLQFQKRLLVHIFISSLIITMLGIMGSFYSQILFDDILPTFSEKSLHTFSLAIVVLVITRIITESFRNKLFMYISNNMSIPMMLGFFKHVIRMPADFFGTLQVGEILSRLQDTAIIKDAISSATLSLLIDLFMVIFGGIILFRQNSTLFYITFVPIVLLVIVLLSFKRTYYKMNRELLKRNSDYASFMVEAISGEETIKAFSLEESISFRAENKFVKLLQAVFKTENTENYNRTLQNIIDGVYSIVVLWVGTYFIFKGTLSIGELLAFNALLTYYLTPIKNIIMLQPKIQKAVIASERLSDIIDLEVEKNVVDAPIYTKKLSGDIVFKDVTICYRGRKPVFSDLNLEIKQGETIALVGESGCGKSTLAKLLMRLMTPRSGYIRIGSHNLEDYDLKSLRDRIVYVSQTSFLFTGTILENLTVSDPDISMEEVVEACKRVKMDEFIDQLPMRYNTMVEENGSNFSGGQRQRLALARGLLKKGEIFIFDEVTNQLDPLTEQAVQSVMDEIAQERTSIIITHRIANIKHCNKIFVMEQDNGILACGTHEELLRDCPRYKEMCIAQKEEVIEV